MGFLVHKSDIGAVPPNEYLPASVGEYTAGQLLKMDGGKLASIDAAMTTIPPYVCATEKEVAESGDVLAVNRINRDLIYETSLSAASAAAAPGGKLQITSGGLQVSTGTGPFEIVSLDGTAADSVVRGRFV